MTKEEKIKQEYSKKVLAALAQGNSNQINQNVQMAIEKDDAQTLAVLGETLIDSGYLTPAEMIFRHLIRIEPDNLGAKVHLAEILNEEGQTDEALLLLDEISPEDEHYLAALIQKADIYQTLDLPEVSESLLKKALTIAPDQMPVIFGMAELLYSESKYAAALKYYQKLLQKGETSYFNQNLLVRKANCLAFLGQYESAAKIYENFNDFILHDDDLFLKGSVAFELKNYQNAVETLELLRQRTPDYARAYLILAQAYEALNQLATAYTVAQKGCEIDNFDLALQLEFSQLALKSGYQNQAISGFKRVLKNDPDNVIALINLSNLALQRQDNQAVTDLLTNKETLDPQLSWNLGVAWLNQDKLKLAQENLLAVFNDLQDNPAYLQDLISLFQKENQRKPLLSMMQLYLKLVPSDDKMALAYESLRDEIELNG